MKHPTLEDYTPIVGLPGVEELFLLARPLRGLRVRMVNSTRIGGGVAEILARLIPLLGSLGIEVVWDVIRGDAPFFDVTKEFHNALHGGPYRGGRAGFDTFLEYNRRAMDEMAIDEDVVVIHDPQPAALVEKRREGQRWIWRCHIDVSRPNPEVWDFLAPWVKRYDAAIFSSPGFAQNLPIPQFLFYPSIDPLAEKNREMSGEEVDGILDRLDIPRDRPLITQVSRFDRLKDPVGVIEAFRRVRRYVSCRLLLVGGEADDDPEGTAVLAEAREAAKGDPDVLIRILPPTANLEINAIQRASTIVVQKSLREGFGLTVTEALWKRKPVIGSAVGGIPLQIVQDVTGRLVHSVDGCAFQIRQLLSDPDLATRLGEAGHTRVKEEFLITQTVRRYLMLFHLVGRSEDIVELSG